MVIVGIDAHTQSHTAAAIDEHGRELATLTVGARPAELDRLTAWIEQLGEVGLVAIEGAKGFGLPITRRLLGGSVQVVDVPTHLTALGRRSSRSRGKDDPADAVTIARMALREPGLPRLRASHLASDLKLLVDARDQLVAEGTRIRNRLHALLLTLAPGYRAETGALEPADRADRKARPHRVGHLARPHKPARRPQRLGRIENRALFTVAMVQARWDSQGSAYLARKRGEGKTPAEARRCLMRHLASVVYRAMVADARARHARSLSGAA